jgi:hypothetical protein
MAIVKEASEALAKVRLGQRKGARVVASALPRTIVYTQPRRRVVKPGPAGSPRAILQQEVATNMAGKKAVGPWLGPLTAAPEGICAMDSLMPSTIFLDTRAIGHLALDHEHDKQMVSELYKAQSDSGLLQEAADAAAVKVANQQLQLQRDKHQQARAVQAQSMLMQASRDKTPPARNAMRRMHVINQPRRFN